MSLSKILNIVFVGAIILSAVFAFYRYQVQGDFIVKAQAPCDPATEFCFIAVCDPLEEECSGIVEQDTSYYKILYRNARNIPECAVESEEGCDAALTCWKGESDCQLLQCDPEDVLEGDACTNPEDFQVSISPEEDGAGESMIETNEIPQEVVPENIIPAQPQDISNPEKRSNEEQSIESPEIVPVPIPMPAEAPKAL